MVLYREKNASIGVSMKQYSRPRHPEEHLVRRIILGNAGAGKTTLARRSTGARAIPILTLDQIAWEGTRRKPFEESLRHLDQFLLSHEDWVIEGCYGDLIEAALPHCTELIFLNPGIDVCIANCHNRTWEPDKFASAGAQTRMLERLIDWIKQYETRDDEYGLKCHRRIFDNFNGAKREYRVPA